MSLRNRGKAGFDESLAPFAAGGDVHRVKSLRLHPQVTTARSARFEQDPTSTTALGGAKDLCDPPANKVLP